MDQQVEVGILEVLGEVLVMRTMEAQVSKDGAFHEDQEVEVEMAQAVTKGVLGLQSQASWPQGEV